MTRLGKQFAQHENQRTSILSKVEQGLLAQLWRTGLEHSSFHAGEVEWCKESPQQT